ncbi:MAG: ribose-5-phosphate isomerase RpiA [Pseudomonadota bacterium]
MTDELPPAEKAKRAAAARALDWIEDGMKLGLGTGSTAKWFVDLLAPHLAETGKKIVGVPTSSRTKAQAERLGIPLSTLGDLGSLDVTVDGADEFDGAMNLIKGGGGALLQEKIVAAASEKMVVISDPSKEVKMLGAFDLPIEVVRFGCESTQAHVAEVLRDADVAGRVISRRMADGEPFITDEGHYILDLALQQIGDPDILSVSLNLVPGVVETGLFCGMADAVIVGQSDGTAQVIEGDPSTD